MKVTTHDATFFVEFKHFNAKEILEKKKEEAEGLNNRKKKNLRSFTLVKIFEYDRDKESYIFMDWDEEICSGHDNFSKSYGRRKALAKVLKKIFVEKETRTQFWNAYYNYHNDQNRRFK